MNNSYHVVLDALTRAASQNAELLKGAERQLESWETQLGFYSTLLTIASDQSLDINIRWLSVLCTKNGVDKHWRNTITAAEKVVIREKLLSCINEPINQIALQLAVIISKVARYDFPNNWQELFPTLLNGIQSTDQLHHLRALLTGHHVIKALASKRLTFDQKIFQQLTATIFSTIFHQWINYSKLFLEEVQRDATNSSQLLESAFLSLKILRKLVVYGFKDCSREPDAANFISLIFQQMRPFLECRTVLLNRDHMLQICEKYVVLLTKVLHDVLENEPYAFVPFIQSSLECSVTFCFNKDFQDLLFERLIIQLLNLIKSILIKDSLKPERWVKDTESRTSLRLQTAKIKSEFFTVPVLSEICQQLISRYFLLSENDLNCWETNPEEFATEEKGDSWKVSLRPSIESLFLTLFREFRSILTPIVVEMTKEMQTNSTTDLIGILKKDAIYNAVGLAAFDLYDEIDFNNWFTNVLIPELRIKENGYYIIRRRVIWLIGQWVGVKMSPDLRPLLYEMILQCMSPDENLVVRLAAAHTLKVTVDDFEFREEQFYPLVDDYKFREEHFYPFLERNLSSLFVLLQQVKECDLKMSVLHVLSFIIERMKSQVEPHVNSLMQYLPQLWENSGDHNMLRCAIVSCFVQLVKSLRRTSEFLHNSLLPMIALCTDVSQPPHVYLLEDGLDLWYAIMANTTISSPELLDLAANLLPLLEYNNESLRMCLQITENYIILSPEIYLKRYGQDLVRIFRSAVTDLKSEGINLILRVVETAFIVFPTDGPLLFQPLLPFVLNLILTPDELPLSLSLYLSLFSRVILHNQSCFVHVLQERANETQKNVNIVLGELFDLWLKKMPLLNPLTNRKLMGLALTCLLTSGSEVVHEQICGILLAIVEVLHDVTKYDDAYVDLLVFKNNSDIRDPDSEDSEPDDDSNQDEFTDFVHENEKRKFQLLKIDPVHTVVLRDFFCKQMMALEQSVGTAKFQDLMSTVDIETMQQVQKYLQNISPGDQCMKENSM